MNRWLRWIPAVILMSAQFVLSHQPSLPGPSFAFADKLQHLMAYTLLAVSYGYALAPRLPSAGRLAVAVVALTALYGATDELHQSLVAGRHASVADWVADLAGGVLGAALLTRRSFAGLLGLWENPPR